jgi:hypothetical protein
MMMMIMIINKYCYFVVNTLPCFIAATVWISVVLVGNRILWALCQSVIGYCTKRYQNTSRRGNYVEICRGAPSAEIINVMYLHNRKSRLYTYR